MSRYKHLTYTARLKLEAMYSSGKKVKEIAEALHVHTSTIYRELKRGAYNRLRYEDWEFQTAYSADIADQKYRANLAAKGGELKLGNDRKLAEYIERKIIHDKYSPAAVLGEIRRKHLSFATEIRSVSTIYSYIDKGVFLHLTNKNLPRKGSQKRNYRHIRPARTCGGHS